MGYGYYCSASSDFFGSGRVDLPKDARADFQDWKREQENRIKKERANDPKTVWGWALRAFK